MRLYVTLLYQSDILTIGTTLLSGLYFVGFANKSDNVDTSKAPDYRA